MCPPKGIHPVKLCNIHVISLLSCNLTLPFTYLTTFWLKLANVANVALAIPSTQTEVTLATGSSFSLRHTNNRFSAVITMPTFRKVLHTLKRYFKLEGVSKGTRVIQDSHIQHLYLRHCCAKNGLTENKRSNQIPGNALKATLQRHKS